MKTIILLVVASVIGTNLALDCSAKFKEFHTCEHDNHKKHHEEIKAKIEALKPKFHACFTENGCAAPAHHEHHHEHHEHHEHHGNHTEGHHHECEKELKKSLKEHFETCVKKAAPGFVFPPHHDKQHPHHHHHHHHLHPHLHHLHRHHHLHPHPHHHHHHKAAAHCAKAEAVHKCIHDLVKKTRPTHDEAKAHFEASCKAHQTCKAHLGAECEAQLKADKKAFCECHHQGRQHFHEIFNSVAACKNVRPHDHKKDGKEHEHHHEHKEHKEHSCEHKDYCKLGFDALVKDLEEYHKAHPHHHHHHHEHEGHHDRHARHHYDDHDHDHHRH